MTYFSSFAVNNGSGYSWIKNPYSPLLAGLSQGLRRTGAQGFERLSSLLSARSIVLNTGLRKSFVAGPTPPKYGINIAFTSTLLRRLEGEVR
jgi:hypothetical protein